MAMIAAMLMSACTAGQGSVYALRGRGLIYSHTWEPLMVNANATRVSGGNGSSGSVKELQIQSLRVTWSDNAIGDIARKAGLDTVYYADLEVLRVLTVWSQQTVHIYGTSDGGEIHLEVPAKKSIDLPMPVKEPLLR